jgi:DNA-binding MarR family transcriptional regulator
MSYQTLNKQAEELHRVLVDLVKRYQFRDRNEICCDDISVSQCYTLEFLGDTDGLTMNELSEKMHLNTSTMTRTVDQLVKKGYAIRSESPQDRRVCNVYLTNKGKAMLLKMQQRFLKYEKAILSRIKSEDRENVIFTMKELIKAVDTIRQENESCCIID